MFDREDYSDLSNDTMEFAVIATDDSEYWEFGDDRPADLEGVLTLYMFVKGEATHICSLTPNTQVRYVDTCFMGLDFDTHESWIERHEEIARETESHADYIGYVDPARRDPRWIADHVTVNLAEFAEEHGIEVTDRDSYLALRDAIWDDVMDDARCNFPSSPAVTWDDEYRTVLAEQAEARRAENRPPLATLGWGQLPLFAAAAKALGIDTFEKARPLGWI